MEDVTKLKHVQNYIFTDHVFFMQTILLIVFIFQLIKIVQLAF